MSSLETRELDLCPLFADVIIEARPIPPTPREEKSFIDQTQGILTNDLRRLLNWPLLQSRTAIVYVGRLTILQQLDILQDLSNNTLRITSQEHGTTNVLQIKVKP